jgi:hypothetical protein
MGAHGMIKLNSLPQIERALRVLAGHRAKAIVGHVGLEGKLVSMYDDGCTVYVVLPDSGDVPDMFIIFEPIDVLGMFWDKERKDGMIFIENDTMRGVWETAAGDTEA